MFNIFSASKKHTFNIAAIGSNWLTRPLTHDGILGTLQVRQLPSSLARRDYRFVALAQIDRELDSSDLSSWNDRVQNALERQGACLLVLIHQAGANVTWYAYAGSRKALDDAFVSLKDPAVRWGINEDRDWQEYDHARDLVGA
jgi:hypothetical protein